MIRGVIVVGLLAGTCGIPTVSAHAAGATPEATRFVVVPPCRMIDTRDGAGLGADQELELDVAGACGVPAGAVAAALTVTVTATGGPGFATVFPADVGRPQASTSNWDTPGQTRANTALVRLSAGGAVRIWASSPTHVVVDVAGAFVPATASAAGRYVPITSQRVLDTRVPGAPDPGRPITVALPAGVPTDATALAVNLTLTETTGFDFVTAYAAGSAAPRTSVLNADGTGQTRAAGAIVAVSPGGITLATAFASHLVVDVVGYFTGVSGPMSDAGLFVPVVPTRVLDTRSATPPLYHRGAREIEVLGVTGGPVAAVAANWTLTQTTRAGWLATYPSRTARGEASTINTDSAGQTVANLGIVTASDVGITAYSDGGTHLVVDVTGWFTGAPVKATEPLPPPNDPPALPGCFPTGRSAVADKLAQRFWLCVDGVAITESLPMTTGALAYALPVVGTYTVFSRQRYGRGLHGEVLNHFVAFFRTPRGNRIGFHEVVNQDPSTVGDLDRRGSSSGCFRVLAGDAVLIWNHLQYGDHVVVLTP
jgi:hypothetical protein